MIEVAMIGPVPELWGGLTAGGGVASHVQGLISALPYHDIRVRLLADNTDAAKSRDFPDLGEFTDIHAMIRPHVASFPRDLVALGLGRVIRIVTRILARPAQRRAAPFSRQVKFVGQASNFDRFLAEARADILHVHHAEYRQYLCQQVVGTSLPLVATAHSVNVLARPYPEWLVSLITANYRRANWLIAVSNYVRDTLIEHGADPTHITVIPNGVDVEAFRPRERSEARAKLGLPPGDVILLFTGNLIPRKGVGVLLRAAQQCVARHPQIRVVLIGQGQERDNLARLAAELGIADRATFVGYRPLTEMPLWYQACDLFVMPSWAEGLSVSLLEAMSCGRPVVTTFPATGEHDAIQDGQNGLLISYGNVDELAAALGRLIASPALREQMGDEARHTVEREFSWRIVGRRTAEVYRALVAEREAPV